MRDKKWIEAIRRKDPDAINAVMNAYARLLWKIGAAVLQNVGNEQDVEECVADAFIWLWEHPDRFDPERGSLKALLSVVVRSRALDRYRELCRHSALPLEEAVISQGLGVQEEMILQEQTRQLQEAVRELAEPVREILIRRFYQNQKPREIALAMNLTVKQVDNALYRGKRQLYKRLTED